MRLKESLIWISNPISELCKTFGFNSLTCRHLNEYISNELFYLHSKLNSFLKVDFFYVAIWQSFVQYDSILTPRDVAAVVSSFRVYQDKISNILSGHVTSA